MTVDLSRGKFSRQRSQVMTWWYGKDLFSARTFMCSGRETIRRPGCVDDIMNTRSARAGYVYDLITCMHAAIFYAFISACTFISVSSGYDISQLSKEN